MRKVILYVLCVTLICSVAHGETVTIPQGSKNSFYGRFLAAYCAASDTYWVMTRESPSIFGMLLPFGYKYRVRSISGDLESVQYGFSSMRGIYSILPTEKYVFYELENLFDSTSASLWCYNIESGEKTKVIDRPMRNLMACVNDCIIYCDLNHNLCSFSLTSGEENVITKCQSVISADSDAIYYSAPDGSIGVYALHSGVCSRYEGSNEIHAYTIGYGYMMDWDNSTLHSVSGDSWSMDLRSASLAGLNDEYIYMFYPANSSQEMGRLEYAPLTSPDHMVSIDVGVSLDRNVNVVNNNVFIYSKHAKGISVTSLATQKNLILSCRKPPSGGAAKEALPFWCCQPAPLQGDVMVLLYVHFQLPLLHIMVICHLLITATKH